MKVDDEPDSEINSVGLRLKDGTCLIRLKSVSTDNFV